MSSQSPTGRYRFGLESDRDTALGTVALLLGSFLVIRAGVALALLLVM